MAMKQAEGIVGVPLEAVKASRAGRAYLAAQRRLVPLELRDPGIDSGNYLAVLVVAFVRAMPEGEGCSRLPRGMLDRLLVGHGDGKGNVTRNRTATSSSMSKMAPKAKTGPTSGTVFDALFAEGVLEDLPDSNHSEIRATALGISRYGRIQPDSETFRTIRDWVRTHAFIHSLPNPEEEPMWRPNIDFPTILRIALEWFEDSGDPDALVLASFVARPLTRLSLLDANPERLDRLAFAAEEHELDPATRAELWGAAGELRLDSVLDECEDRFPSDQEPEVRKARAYLERGLSLLPEALASPEMAVRDLRCFSPVANTRIAEIDILLGNRDEAMARSKQLFDGTNIDPDDLRPILFRSLVRFARCEMLTGESAFMLATFRMALDIGADLPEQYDIEVGPFAYSVASRIGVTGNFAEALPYARLARALARRSLPRGAPEREDIEAMYEVVSKGAGVPLSRSFSGGGAKKKSKKSTKKRRR